MQFSYQAYDNSGRRVDGNIDASDSNDALNKLNARGLLPLNLKQAGAAATKESWLTRDIGGGSSLGVGQRAKMARLLATLINAGIPLDRALKLLEAQAATAKARRVAANAAEAVIAGKTLSAALVSAQSGFAEDEMGLIKAGEQTGALGPVLEDLGGMLERREEMKSRMVSAMVYPAILLVMAIMSLIVIATVLIPNIAPLFENSSQGPPLMIRLILSATELLKEHGVTVLVLILALGVLLFIILRRPAAKLALEKIVLRLPFLGRILAAAEAARICRTLGTLLRQGVAMQTALAATRAAVRRTHTRNALAGATERVTSGTKLSDALADVDVISPPIRQMIAIGEQTNKLDQLLLHSASSGEADVAQRIERLMTLLTPLMTIVLGLLIGGMIMSVMRAILSVNDLAVS